MALTQEQLDIITRTVLGEARGEGEMGMVAVAHNIRNRSLSGQFPSDPAQVALQPYQYSTWNKGEGGNNPQQFSPSSQQYQNARKLVEEVWGGNRPDPTNGALFYHTPQVNPAWAGEVNKHGTTRVGNHIFYNGHPVPPGEIPNVVASQTDTQRPQQIEGRSNAPTSAASRQVPTNWFTPRLAPSNDQAYVYQIPNQTNASLEGGYGSLTPSIGQRPPIPMPRPRPVTDRDIASASGSTIASVPTVPAQPQRLPPLPPSSISTPNMVQTSMNRASAAVDPGLQRALEQRRNMVDTSMQRVASAVDPALQRALEARNAPGVGKPPATRSVASVPVPASPARPTGPALSRDSVAQAQRGAYMAEALPNMRSQVAAAPMPTTAVPNAIPGPSRVAQVASRLPATQWGVPDALLAENGVIPPAVPDVGVASAMSVVPGFPPMPRNRPLRSGVNVQMPTPMGQRPTLPMPRANPNALRVTVNGAGSYSAPQRAPTPTREQQIAAILARSRGPAAFGNGGTIDGAVQPIGTLSGRR